MQTDALRFTTSHKAYSEPSTRMTKLTCPTACAQSIVERFPCTTSAHYITPSAILLILSSLTKAFHLVTSQVHTSSVCASSPTPAAIQEAVSPDRNQGSRARSTVLLYCRLPIRCGSSWPAAPPHMHVAGLECKLAVVRVNSISSR